MFCSNCGAQLKDKDRFCGECAWPVKGTEKLQGIGAPAFITGLWLDYVAMRSHYHFSLQEKDSTVLFSYDYLNKDCGYLEQENVPVNRAYMQELRAFVKENDYVHLKSHIISRKDPNFEHDAPFYALRLKWENYESFEIQAMGLPPNGEKLKEFFISIAENTQ